MAAAFAAMRGLPAPSGVCFNCNKPGHFKKDCPALKKDKPKTAPLCQRCRRGPHSANQCHSKYDSIGRLLHRKQGNWDQGSGWRRCALTQVPQPPMQIPVPLMPNGSLPQVFA
ncbi:GAK5 protein, partial [Oriolus oriolus]|nr:GAK5 protein [Oriolus oriolus]